MTRARSETGQSSVELVALLPVVVLLAGLLWQAALAGEAIWLAGSAARAAARAHAVGGDPLAAARSRLPASLEHGLRVRALGAGAVEVRLAVPLALGHGSLTTITERAAMAPQGR